MPFLDHLEELRWRILWSLLGILVGTAAGWLLLDRIELIELLKRPIAPYLPGGRLVFTSPAEPFMLTLKVAFALGCVLASPVVIYQIWAFLAPALYEREKRLIVPALAVGAVLFLGGAMACYQWLLPAALRVLLNFQPTELTPMITIDRYFGMAIPFVIACGIVAELPLVVTILASLGVVTPHMLSRQRRYAIVVAAFLAALLTPPDVVSMLLMLGPLLLLYEISIWCAWVASRRRARRMAAAAIVLLVLGAGSLDAQARPPQPPQPRQPPQLPQRPVARDTTRAARPPADTSRGQSVDTATARKLGLPTAPSRTFPPSDAVMDSLQKLEGYSITKYTSDTLVMVGDSQTLYLRREAFVDRDGTKLEADSIRYHEASCRLDATGDPHLFDEGTVLVGEGMRYDTCLRRGSVRDALTDFQQGGAKWYVRGHIAADSGNRRVYVGGARFTSDPQPVPDYHFSAGKVKWINKRTMVARPAVLYVRDVPIMWLPFIFQDIRGGRRSGILFPRFGLNDLVRPTRSYSRHVSDFGYYFAINDYVDALVTGDWFAGRNVSVHAQTQYRWIDRFINGRLSFTRTSQLDQTATNTRLGWTHSQRFNSTTDFNASIDYMTNGRVIQRNSLDPYEVTATVGSNASFNKRFGWGAFNVGGTRRQDLSSDRIDQTFPVVALTPTTVELASWLTWSPTFNLTNTQTFHVPGTPLLVPPPAGDTTGKPDTLRLFAGDRITNISFQTPIRIGRWNWSNSITVVDASSNQRKEFELRDSTGGVRRVTFGQTFETRVDWQTGINLPTLFSGSWKLQPGVSIINTTSAGPFMLRNQFSHGAFIQQGKRLAFSMSTTPTFFGFFPGFGPLARIRHSVSPQISWQYAPGAEVSKRYANALDPTGKTLNARSDPQQTISLSLSQNFEAKLKPPAGDTAAEREPRKIRLLGITTSGVSYNFEQAKDSGRVGWQTPSITNTFLTDLLQGFTLSTVHDLWRGQVGSDTAKFDPFLQSVTASFQVTPATVVGIARMLGLSTRPAPPPPTDTTGQEGPRTGSPDYRRYQGATRDPYTRGPAGGVGAGGRQFSLGVQLSSSRSRLDTPEDRKRAGRQTAGLNLAFSPTRNWTANWGTSYDIVTKQFGFHSITFQRDLRRWRANFSFYKTGTGNLAFSFNITLTDQPDIKFDYDQRTYVQ